MTENLNKLTKSRKEVLKAFIESLYTSSCLSFTFQIRNAEVIAEMVITAVESTINELGTEYREKLDIDEIRGSLALTRDIFMG